MSDEKIIESLSDQELDEIIDKLCSARDQNPDVQILDHIKSIGYSEQETQHYENAIMEEDILNSFVKSEYPLSQEDMNVLKSKGLYEKYLEKINGPQEEDTMQSIEEEIRRSLEAEDEVTEVISEEVITEDASFQTTEDTTTESMVINEDTNIGVIEEASEEPVNPIHGEGQFNALKQALTFPSFVAGQVLDNQPYVQNETFDDVVTELSETFDMVTSPENIIVEAISSTVVEEDNDKEMSIEEFNDVPATEISLPDDVITSELMSKYDGVTTEEAMQLISVMNRYKAGEKFNVFEALPDSLKKVITTEAMSCGADKSTINFFAKSFINDLVNNTYLDREIKNFNDELTDALGPMNNIAGTVMDEYSDDVYHKFTDQLEDKANEIEAENPEKAAELRLVSKSFKEAITLERIIALITETPSLINKAYKTARDNFKKFNYEYNTKVSNTNPAPRTLDYLFMGLRSASVSMGYPDEYLNTLVVLAANSVLKAIEANTLTEHIYAYYLSNAIYTIMFTANNGDVNKMVSNNVQIILDKIQEYMAPLEARNSKKNRKRKRK